MSFTDEDLKRLKIDSEAWVSPYWDHRKIQALLARLEAAEKALSEIEGLHGRASIDAWLQASGKDR